MSPKHQLNTIQSMLRVEWMDIKAWMCFQVGFLCVLLQGVHAHSFHMCIWKLPWNATCLFSFYFHSSSVDTLTALSDTLISFDTSSPRYWKKTQMKAGETNMGKKKNHVSASGLSNTPSDNESLFPPPALRMMSQHWRRKREAQRTVAPQRAGIKPTTFLFMS